MHICNVLQKKRTRNIFSTFDMAFRALYELHFISVFEANRNNRESTNRAKGSLKYNSNPRYTQDFTYFIKLSQLKIPITYFTINVSQYIVKKKYQFIYYLIFRYKIRYKIWKRNRDSKRFGTKLFKSNLQNLNKKQSLNRDIKHIRHYSK